MVFYIFLDSIKERRKRGADMKRIRVIWQYILFYFIISAIPILAILFYFYPMARLVVINKAKESNVNVTRNITNTMNAQISSIYSIAREIKTDSKLP